MVDYLCLKLHCLTDAILDNAHFDNLRKYRTYRLMDELEYAKPLYAIPIIDEKHIGAIQTGEQKLITKLLTRMGIIKKTIQIISPDKDPMRKILAKVTGAPLVPIERMMDYQKTVKVTPKGRRGINK